MLLFAIITSLSSQGLLEKAPLERVVQQITTYNEKNAETLITQGICQTLLEAFRKRPKICESSLLQIIYQMIPAKLLVQYLSVSLKSNYSRSKLNNSTDFQRNFRKKFSTEPQKIKEEIQNDIKSIELFYKQICITKDPNNNYCYQKNRDRDNENLQLPKNFKFFEIISINRYAETLKILVQTIEPELLLKYAYIAQDQTEFPKHQTIGDIKKFMTEASQQYSDYEYLYIHCEINKTTASNPSTPERRQMLFSTNA